MEWKAQDHMMLPSTVSFGVFQVWHTTGQKITELCLASSHASNTLRGDLIGEQQTCVPEQQGVTYPARTPIRAPP